MHSFKQFMANKCFLPSISDESVCFAAGALSLCTVASNKSHWNCFCLKEKKVITWLWKAFHTTSKTVTQSKA